MKSLQYIFKRKTVLAGVAAAMLATACTKNFEDLNTNPNGISEEELKQDFMHIGEPLGQIQRSIYVYSPSWVVQVQQNLMGDLFSQYTAVPNPFGNLNNNNNTYNLVDGWNVVLWGCAYGTYASSPEQSVMPVCRYLEKLTKTDYPQYYAWMKVLKVFTMHRVADAYGPVIYTKYGVINPDGSVDYDSQKDAYYAFFADLDESIKIFTQYVTEGKDITFAGFDLSDYAGSYRLWCKMANTLRLRLALRISKIDPNKAKAEGELALKHPLGLLEKAEETFVINTRPLEHPLLEISSGWGDVRMSAAMESYLTGLKDPRLNVYFEESKEYPGQYKGIRQGVEMTTKARYENFSALSKLLFSNKKILLMTAAEAWFLKAEAAIEGWQGAGDAKTNYAMGVKTSFDQHGIATKYDDYIANTTNKPAPYVDPKNGANSIPDGDPLLSTITVAWEDGATKERKRERIITQKWIAGFPEGQEAWAEFRRTGYPKLFPVKINNSGGKIPNGTFIRRVNFVSTEYETNPKGVQKAINLLGGPDNGGTRLWWDKP
ncbi:SusD/RagB family nutrient-binding outer membrane lipoprotein [Chitinophaga sp. NPDC101104]|uniref:SusD/RagB family nutrient-binding outer membrane lipoprotein n=1 Tax=Chitinophaga sp. NPDC101104 TaxID=3390561 RepID=UPI003CFC8D7D